MRNKPHTIAKHLYEAEYFSDSNGLSFRHEFTELVKRSLLSVVEEVLDEMATQNMVLRIEKIEIELTQVAYPFDEWSIKNQLRKCLRDELNFKIVALRHQKENITTLKDTVVFATETDEELLLYFLQYGMLPWWHSESNSYKVSIEELIQKISRSKPGTIVRVLQKVENFEEQVRRFLSYCSDPVLFGIITSVNDISVLILKNFKYSLSQTGIEKYLAKFDTIFKEFLVSFFCLKKRSTKSIIELQTEFVIYILRQNKINQSRLTELFPEYFISSWFNYHFPEEFLRLLAVNNIHISDVTSIDINKYRSLLKSLLLDLTNERKKGLITPINGFLLKNHNEFKENEITKNSLLDVSLKNRKESEKYFTDLEEKILQYLLYGIVSLKDRIASVTGIEAFMLKLHVDAPERMKVLITKIELRHYPLIVQRVERDFTKQTADIFFDLYFDKEIALKELQSLEQKDKILKIFFQKGVVPWEMIIGNNIQYAESVIRIFYQQDADYFRKVFKTFLSNNPTFIGRVEAIYSKEFISFVRELIKDIIPELMMDQEINEHKEEIPREVDLIVYYLTYFEKNKKLSYDVAFSVQDLVEYFVDHFPAQAKMYFTIAAYQSYFILEQNFSSRILSIMNKWIASSDTIEQSNSKPKSEKNTHKSLEDIKPLEINEPIYIVNAGLVLINPFLQRFFSLCGLIEKRKFKNEESAQKAVHLLHYIATKLENPEEHKLVLNKLLCGIPLTEPIDLTIELTEDEKDTCENLIRGVIENWPILKKTSNENFRVSLLQREGRLTKEEGMWRLKVEERSYDVLLDKLPWSISMIKLPWMEKMLQVEWR